MKTVTSVRLTLLLTILVSLLFLFDRAEAVVKGENATCCPSEDSICYFSEELNFPGYYAIDPGRKCPPPGWPFPAVAE